MINLQDHPEFKKVMDKLDSLSGSEVNLGWDEGLHYPEGEYPIWEAALNHEFGTDKEPARPVWVPVIEKKRNSWINGATKVLAKVASGETDLQTGLEYIGSVIVGDVVRQYKTNTPPELAPATLARRQNRYKTNLRKSQPPPAKFDHTLIDTGLMVTTLRAQVLTK